MFRGVCCHFRTASKASPVTTIPNHILNSLPKISVRENDLLSEIPTFEEITAVIHEIGAGKAPGPDGLPSMFYHNCWDVVGEEAIKLVQNFFINKVLPDALNHTFLCLLPKKRDAFNPTDFRLISLCNVLYKLITKIITLRLRPLLNNLISTMQNAFVPGRQISDNLVLAQELIHSMKNSKNHNCSFALKLDMAKAYDRVNWPFLSKVLTRFGLTGATHDIIMACVTSATFSVFVNGSPHRVKVMAQTDKYLGKQLLLPAARISSYADLIAKCTQKLAAWKANSLSQAGKLTLLKSSLASIPIYTMGTTMMPKGVANKLSQLQRQFWWGSTTEKKKLCLISWDKITKPKEQGGLGVRNPELVNLSLISKLVWRFLTEKDSLWSKTLRAKYLRNGFFWDARKPHVCSTIWKSMLHCRDLIKPGVCWEIGSGTHVNIWRDPWIITLPGFRAVRRENAQEEVTNVCDLFFSGTRTWNINLLHALFETSTAEAIARIRVSITDTDDRLLWLPHSKGSFTAKSMYKQLNIVQPSSSNSNSPITSFNWKKLWHINGVAPRVLLFLWKTINGGLAVGEKLNRIMGINGLCTECMIFNEPDNHLLIHCKTARDVWLRSNLLNNIYHQGLTVQELFSSLLAHDLDSVRRGCAIIWAIWKARNNRIFKGKLMDAAEVHRHADVMYKEYKNHRSGILPEAHNSDTTTTRLNWILPPDGFIKINIDGAHRNGLNAAGALVRDAQGHFLGAVSMASFPGTSIEAEARGFLLAIELVNSMQLRNVIIESDALIILNSIWDPGIVNEWRINSTVQTCKQLLRDRADVTFKFAHREANSSAHALAAYAINHDVSRSWNGGLPPPFLIDHLFADLASIVTPDVINE